MKKSILLSIALLWTSCLLAADPVPTHPLTLDTSGRPTSPLNLASSNVSSLPADKLPSNAVQIAGTFTLGGAYTFTVAPIFSDAAGTRSALGLGTVSTHAATDFDAAGAASTAQGYAIQRANHTGTQASTTITGLAAVATSGSASDLGSGTLNSARLPTNAATAISRDPANGHLVLPAGTTLTAQSGQTIDLSGCTLTLPADVPRLDGGGNLIIGLAEITAEGGDGYFGNLTASYFSGDGSNLTNLPPPVGLYFDNPGPALDYLNVGLGAFLVGDGSGGATQVLSAPNTLGPLDGSALTGSASGLTVGEANNADHAIAGFNQFFHDGFSYNLDTSLPGDGTGSLAYGNITWDADGNMVVAGLSTNSIAADLIYVGSTLVADDSHLYYPMDGSVMADGDGLFAPGGYQLSDVDGYLLTAGQTYHSGAPTPTGYLVVKDGMGAKYRIPAVLEP